MVSPLSILFMIVSLLLVIGFPVALAVILYRRHRISLRAVLVGAVIFLVFQLLTRIPLLSVAAQMPWYQQLAASSPFVLIALLSFSAGLFEEIGRWLGFRFLLKGRWQTKNGVAYGVGHGGFEAISLIGLSYINNLVLSLAINSGTFDALVTPQAGAMADTLRAQLVGTPSYQFLFGGIERVLAILFHIGLSVLVLNAVRRRKPVLVLLAILIHGLVNLVAVQLSQLSGGLWLSEGFLLVVAVLAYLYIRREWQADEAEPTPVTPVEAAQL